jgi:xylan 1,4-beta-xylosidase
MKRLILLLLAIAFSAARATSALCADRLIAANVREIRGPLAATPKACIGAGRVAEGLRADWQRQLAYVKQECGFTYLRMHGLLGDDMGVYHEDRSGQPEYNWQYVDEVYDFNSSTVSAPPSWFLPTRRPT